MAPRWYLGLAAGREFVSRCGLEVGVALEIAQWLGTQPGSATHDR